MKGATVKSAHRQHGYVLMMTLVLTLLAAVSLTGVARRSFLAAMEARSAEESLRQKWTVAGAKRAILDQAQRLLIAAEETTQIPQRQLVGTYELQGLRVDYLLTDEQAKVNLNHLLTRMDIQEAVRTIRGLVLESARSTEDVLEVVLDPVLRPDSTLPGSPQEDQPIPQFVGSFGQIFRHPDPRLLMGGAGRPSAVQHITCWGNGKLNLRRASPEAIRQVCTPILGMGKTQSLMGLLENNPKTKVDEVMEALELNAEQEQVLAEILTDNSQCFSLWLRVAGEHRVKYHLLVSAGSGEQAAQNYYFSW